MKRRLATLIAIALCGTLLAGSALAAGSTQVNVTATVVGTCSFNAATYTMDFGTINVTDTGVKSATANLEFTCTNNSAYTIGNFAGNRTLTGPAGNLAYTIDPYTTAGTATGLLQSVALVGNIAEADYAAAAAGTYSETLTINITP